MKTKHILTAMVLPAMLAACTADEIVENNNVNLDGVAKLNPITFTMGENADSRLLWDNTGLGNWKWGAEGDQFSAFLVSAGIAQPVQDLLLTNYVYSSEDGYGYTTTSVMTQGNYWFYAPGSQDKKDNDLISFKMSTAQGPDYYKSDAAQLFFTPLYKLTKEDAPENIELSLTNWYGRAVMPIKNVSEEDFTVRQVILTLNGGKEWVVEGQISVEKMDAAGLKYAYVDGVTTPVRNLDTDATNNEDIAGLKNRLYEAYDIVADNDMKKTAPALVLDLGTTGVKVAKGAEYTFTMLVPATEANVSCEVKFITDKGIVTVNSWDASNYTQSGVQFKHNGLMPMFGFKNANRNQFKSYQIDDDDLIDFGAEYYVTTYNYMMELINTVNGNLTVYNIGDWGVDARMAETIKESDAEVEFTMPIVVEDEETKVALTKVNFAKVTVVEGTEAEFGKKTSSSELVIEADAEVSFADINTAKAEDIANNGTLKVAAAAVITGTITNNGDLTLTDNNPTVNFVNGNVTYANKANTADFELTNAKLTMPVADKLTGDATLTISSDVAMTIPNQSKLAINKHVNGNTVYTVKLINNGEIIMGNSGNSYIEINGEFENNGTVEGEGSSIIRVYGEVENNGDMEPGCIEIQPNASLENNGTLAPATASINYGTVTLGATSKTKITAGNGVVNNDNKANKLSVASGNTVYYTFTAAVNSADVNALDCEEYKLNKIIFNEKLTIDADDENKVTTGSSTSNGITKLSGIKTLEFKKGFEIESEVTDQIISDKITEIIVNGSNVKFEGSNWENIDGDKVCAVGFKGDTKITVYADSKLTIEDMKLIPLGNASTSKSLTFVGETAAGKTQGQVVNKGTVYTGKAGVVYNETDHAAWWSGADAIQGWFNTAASTIVP